jgi:hypothetical protein
MYYEAGKWGIHIFNRLPKYFYWTQKCPEFQNYSYSLLNGEWTNKWINLGGGCLANWRVRAFVIYRVAAFNSFWDFSLWSLNLIKTFLASNNNFLKCWGLSSSKELCGEQAILATKTGPCEPGEAPLRACIRAKHLTSLNCILSLFHSFSSLASGSWVFPKLLALNDLKN